jgi:hybrid cluster-associated redox disulfide protein
MDISPDMTVDQIMRNVPATIRVFLDFHMRCVGCPIGPYHTVKDACREHGVDQARFMRSLLRSALTAGEGVNPRASRIARKGDAGRG